MHGKNVIKWNVNLKGFLLPVYKDMYIVILFYGTINVLFTAHDWRLIGGKLYSIVTWSKCMENLFV